MAGEKVRLSLRNLALALKDQLPLGRAFRNFFVTGVAWGLFSRNSHISLGTGEPKVSYSEKSAMKAASRMSEKHGATFSVYKCAFCNGYHIGRSRTRLEAESRVSRAEKKSLP
jgi:hypothetical protein